MAAKVFESIGKFGLALAVAGGLVNSALYNVDAGHRAVIFDQFRGVQDICGRGRNTLSHPLGTETNHLCLLLSTTTERTYRSSLVAKTCRMSTSHCASTSGRWPASFPRIYPSTGEDYDERVLPSITTEILKSVVARFDAGELITQHELVSGQVGDDLTDRAATFGLILDDMPLTHLTFRKEFTEVVEAKQVAQQGAERARFVVEKAEQQKAAAIISAEGDSKAAELIANSLASLSCESWKLLRTLSTSSLTLGTSPTCRRARPCSSSFPSEANLAGPLSF